MTSARTLLAGLHLLDRQLVDRHDRLVGKVDDVELTRDEETGHLVVTALLSGRGALWRRLGADRLADWFGRLPVAADRDDVGGGRIPMHRVARLGPSITLTVEADELATLAGERVARREIIGRIPGSSDVAE
jgi:hypothetical protein